ncbi:MAG: OmpA family protein [Bacteroidia bacterium]|nr:OmpA family protein [Bacteroidia bacterium]
MFSKHETRRFPQTLLILCLITSLSIFPSCKASKTAKGGAIGATAGGVLGGIIGKKKGNTAAGVLIGAAIGGTAGAVIGRYMDKQAKEIEEEIEGAEVERVGEGILITFDSGLLFDFGSSRLSNETKRNLDEFADILQKYPETDILIEGHTDNVGSDEFNQELSVKRASSVRNYLSTHGVQGSRFSIKGYGEEKPVDDNETESGRTANRRVEVAIYANETLKEDAQDGTISN